MIDGDDHTNFKSTYSTHTLALFPPVRDVLIELQIRDRIPCQMGSYVVV